MEQKALIEWRYLLWEHILASCKCQLLCIRLIDVHSSWHKKWHEEFQLSTGILFRMNPGEALKILPAQKMFAAKKMLFMGEAAGRCPHFLSSYLKISLAHCTNIATNQTETSAIGSADAETKIEDSWEPFFDITRERPKWEPEQEQKLVRHFIAKCVFFSLVWRCDSFLLSWENHLQAHIFTSLRRTARNAQLQNGLFPTNFTCDEHSLQLIVIINNSLRQR